MLLILKRLRLHKKKLANICVCMPQLWIIMVRSTDAYMCGYHDNWAWSDTQYARLTRYSLARVCVSVRVRTRARCSRTSCWHSHMIYQLSLSPLVCVYEWVTAVVDDWGCVHICVIIVVNIVGPLIAVRAEKRHVCYVFPRNRRWKSVNYLIRMINL